MKAHVPANPGIDSTQITIDTAYSVYAFEYGKPSRTLYFKADECDQAVAAARKYGASIAVLNNEPTSADEKYQEDRFNQLVDAHEEEARDQGAEFYNLGWAQGEDFIHSKTDQGRLYSQINQDGSITHEWQER